MKIWLINNYNMLPEHGHLNRNYYLGKYLKQLGHEPIAFVGSHPHNTDLQLIEGKVSFLVYQKEPFPWVLIKTRNYEGSRMQRVLSMLEFYRNMKKAAKHFEKPDAIIGSSAHPLAALLAIRLGKKYGCKGIMEVRDLWPESLVTYGILSRNNLLTKVLYGFEKYMYIHADKIIFTMEGAYDYICNQGWDKYIPKDKVLYINNGIDLELFEKNKINDTLQDEDLESEDTFKVVYTGSIRKANKIEMLLEAAKIIQEKEIKILIWGDGDELSHLEEIKQNEGIDNVLFKGYVQKSKIPYILSHSNANFLDAFDESISQYGISSNKLFDYLAAGKPVLMSRNTKYNPAKRMNCYIEYDISPNGIAKAIITAYKMSSEEYEKECNNSKKIANDYSYLELAKKMITAVGAE